MDKRFLAAEIAGAAFVAACSAFMRRLYDWTDGELLGILFGSVNGSSWELCKTLLLPFLIWSLLELLTLRLPFHWFVAAKTAALYALGAGFLLLSQLTGSTAAGIICVPGAFALSFLLCSSSLRLRGLFAPALVLLFLFVAFYFSLTPFPPRHEFFRDRLTGMYGIIPRHFDYGAAALDALNSI